MRRAKKYHTITDIVGTVYCEQKVVFDRERGDARPLEVRAKAAAGTFEHLRFQVEGQTRAARVQGPSALTVGPQAPRLVAGLALLGLAAHIKVAA